MAREITAESHPRLVRYMQYQGILSEGEAVSALKAVRDNRLACGEAVDHYGGPFRLFADAVLRRKNIRKAIPPVVRA